MPDDNYLHYLMAFLNRASRAVFSNQTAIIIIYNNSNKIINLIISYMYFGSFKSNMFILIFFKYWMEISMVNTQCRNNLTLGLIIHYLRIMLSSVSCLLLVWPCSIVECLLDGTSHNLTLFENTCSIKLRNLLTHYNTSCSFYYVFSKYK